MYLLSSGCISLVLCKVVINNIVKYIDAFWFKVNLSENTVIGDSSFFEFRKSKNPIVSIFG